MNKTPEQRAAETILRLRAGNASYESILSDAFRALTDERDTAIREAEAEAIRGVMLIRCVEHRAVPAYNKNEATGAECAACAVISDIARAEKAEAELKKTWDVTTREHYEKLEAEYGRVLFRLNVRRGDANEAEISAKIIMDSRDLLLSALEAQAESTIDELNYFHDGVMHKIGCTLCSRIRLAREALAKVNRKEVETCPQPNTKLTASEGSAPVSNAAPTFQPESAAKPTMCHDCNRPAEQCVCFEHSRQSIERGRNSDHGKAMQDEPPKPVCPKCRDANVGECNVGYAGECELGWRCYARHHVWPAETVAESGTPTPATNARVELLMGLPMIDYAIGVESLARKLERDLDEARQQLADRPDILYRDHSVSSKRDSELREQLVFTRDQLVKEQVESSQLRTQLARLKAKDDALRYVLPILEVIGDIGRCAEGGEQTGNRGHVYEATRIVRSALKEQP